VKLVLGEDNYLAREGITRVLEELPGVELVGSAGDLDALRDAVRRLRPDVVLTDIRMPPTSTDEGIRLARELRDTHPGTGVVVLSQHVEPLYALALFEHGSDGRAYLLKERLRDADELGRALQAVASGGSLVDPRVVDALLVQLDRRDDSPIGRLSPREREILALVAEGRSNSAIAESLVITKRAVERHINSIFAKLDLADSGDVSRRVKATLVYLADSG
jgi:DNA-binding NarL/FixJ family response regulator